MIREKWFRRILFSSWFLALIPACAFIIYLPSFGNRYTVDVRQENVLGRITYMDLDADTVSERIALRDRSSYPNVLILDTEMRWYDDWPFTDSLDVTISGPFFGDYDSDGFSEIYVFSYKRDSLFLSMYEILQPGSKRIDRIYVDRCGYRNGSVFSWITPAGFHDRNMDGFKEFYFSQSSGGNTGPRKIYFFNVKDKEFGSSDHAALVLCNPVLKDMDRDSKPELFGFTSASGNYPASVPFTDSSAWFMVLNENLEHDIRPIEFRGFASSMSSYEFFNNYLVAFSNNGNDPRAMSSRLIILSPEGKVLREKPVSDLGVRSPFIRTCVVSSGAAQKIIIKGDILIAADSSLNKTAIAEGYDNLYSYNLHLLDLNFDGTCEIVLHSNDHGKLLVFDDKLDLLSEADLRTGFELWRTSRYSKVAGESELFIQSGDIGTYIKMKPNRMYYLGVVVHPAIYFLSLLFIIFVRGINSYQIVQREELKKRLLTLQLKGIKSQLDPHFTFNTFNSVASLIYLNDKQSAYDYMNKFSKLLRKMLNDAENIYRKLGEETDFVNTYLELEKLRFGSKFEYTIETGEGVTMNELVPKLVIHTFAENAIKHGIMHSAKTGLLKILINKEADYLKIVVDDNGIGRERSRVNAQSTGVGLKLTTEFYDILNQLNSKPVTFSITDKQTEEGAPGGTRVEILVPLIQSRHHIS